MVFFLQVHHGPVKLKQTLVSKQRIVHKIKLPPCIVIAVVVPLAWKVQPFRMSEFISNEIQVAFPSQTKGYQSEKKNSDFAKLTCLATVGK